MRTRLWWSLVVLLGGTSCSSSNSNEPPQEPQPDALQAETDAAQPTTDTAQPTSDASQPTNAALQVHLVQASNDSLYAFVRAKFEPGEVVDPWAVRFFGSDGTEKPYFVWDSMTCKTARDGREDWDHRYAALNHHPGRAPEALQMRAQALEAANQQLPDLGAKLLAEDVAAQQAGDSVCNAMYLVRHTVPAFAKEKLTLQIYPTRQVEANVRTLNGTGDAQKTSAAAGELVFDGLPDAVTVRWKGKELFRYAGFKLGDEVAGKSVFITGSSHAEGFRFGNADRYLGGDLTMALWWAPGQPQAVHEPSWEKPWWVYKMGDGAFAATHLFADTPLAIGYGNNPFNASTPGSYQARLAASGEPLVELDWFYKLTEKRIYRLFHPLLDNDSTYDLSELTDVQETLLSQTGAFTHVPTTLNKDGTPLWPADKVQSLEEAMRFVRWQPQDWAYRAYMVGGGESEAEAERHVRQILGAAAGWIHRPVEESELAELVVKFSLRKSSQVGAGSKCWVSLPSVLYQGDQAAARLSLQQCEDPIAVADDAINRVRIHIANGGDPLQGVTKDGGEGLIQNPAYAWVDFAVATRFLKHFNLFSLAPHPEAEYKAKLLEWVDFSLEILGGKPLDLQRLRTSFQALWPNRTVMFLPLLLRAYRETGDPKYADTAKLWFDDMVMGQLGKSPHGYIHSWSYSPQQAEPFDTNYNIAMCDRGLVDPWPEGPAAVGEEKLAQFAAARARYLVFSNQFMDSLETDNMTAIQSQYAGQVPFALGQAALFLYADYPFYAGLVTNPIRWGVIDGGQGSRERNGRRNFFTMKIGNRGAVYWAYAIGSDSPSKSATVQEMLAKWQ